MACVKESSGPFNERGDNVFSSMKCIVNNGGRKLGRHTLAACKDGKREYEIEN